MTEAVLDIHHPNPILRPTVETRCPACGVLADYWKPDYERREYVALFDCDCRMQEPHLPYARQLEHHQHLFRSRVLMKERLGRDYFAMARRSYEVSADNAEVCESMTSLGARDQVFLHGAGGVGKTHLSIVTAMELLNQGITVEYWPEVAFLTACREYTLNHSAFKVPPGRSGQVLIIDDLGKSKTSEFVAQVLYETLEMRVSNGLGLIITSNHSPAEAAQRMVADAANADAVRSRLEVGHVLELQGFDRRGGSR